MTNEELQAILQAAYSGQINPSDMGLTAEPRSEWESYKYNLANPGRTEGEPPAMALSDYPKVWYDRIIGQPLQGMKGAGDALLGRTNPDLETFNKDVLDALSLYAGPTIAKGMLGGVPRATEVSALGVKGGPKSSIADMPLAEIAKMTPEQEAHLILSTFPEESIRNSYLQSDASIQAAMREKVVQGREAVLQKTPPKEPIY